MFGTLLADVSGGNRLEFWGRVGLGLGMSGKLEILGQFGPVWENVREMFEHVE